MKKLFLILVLSGVIFSCSKKEERTPMPFEGKWNIQLVKKGSITEAYTADEIIWEFNKYDELVVTMNVNVPAPSILPIKTSGIYDYVGATEVISIEGTQYAVDVTDGVLILDHNHASGGIMIQLVKVE
jgi:hypothetical protein